MPYMTLEEVATLLRINRKTLERWLKRKEIKGTKAGRHWLFTQEDINEFLKQREN